MVLLLTFIFTLMSTVFIACQSPSPDGDKDPNPDGGNKPPEQTTEIALKGKLLTEEIVGSDTSITITAFQADDYSVQISDEIVLKTGQNSAEYSLPVQKQTEYVLTYRVCDSDSLVSNGYISPSEIIADRDKIVDDYTISEGTKLSGKI